MDLRRLAKPGVLEALIAMAVDRAGAVIAERSASLAPVDTGRLRSSISYKANHLGYYLIADVPYAEYAHIKNPFMPSESAAVKRLETALRRAWA